MKTRFLKLVFFMALSAGMFSSCVNDDDYSVPTMECNDPVIEPQQIKTVEEIFNQATGSAVLYEADHVIEGIVVSSDRGGNFYKKIYLNSVDGERGFLVAINQADLFTDFNVGRKVYIKLKGLYTQIRSNTLEIGALYNGNVGQIAANIYTQHIKRSCTSIPEEQLVKHLTLADVNDSNLGKLVEFDNVQFASSSLGQNYYNPSNVLGGETNHTIEDINGNNLIFRTGQYAEYSGLPVSANSGKIRGVLTKFVAGNGTATYQFIARYTSDIKLENTNRLGEDPDPVDPVDPVEPVEPGDDAVFVFPGADFEDFSVFQAAVTSHGIKSYATQSAGTGVNGTASLHINGTPTANDFVFSTPPYSGLPTTYTKVQFYVKGTSAKSISINLYKEGSGYYPFNLGDVTANKTITPAENNQYIGTINTNGEWVLITLDLTGITDLNLTNTGNNFFAFKVGSNSAYNLHIDNIVIE